MECSFFVKSFLAKSFLYFFFFWLTRLLLFAIIRASLKEQRRIEMKNRVNVEWGGNVLKERNGYRLVELDQPSLNSSAPYIVLSPKDQIISVEYESLWAEESFNSLSE
jgi:hypothetical protein